MGYLTYRNAKKAKKYAKKAAGGGGGFLDHAVEDANRRIERKALEAEAVDAEERREAEARKGLTAEQNVRRDALLGDDRAARMLLEALRSDGLPMPKKFSNKRPGTFHEQAQHEIWEEATRRVIVEGMTIPEAAGATAAAREQAAEARGDEARQVRKERLRIMGGTPEEVRGESSEERCAKTKLLAGRCTLPAGHDGVHSFTM
jgi:hypothetical protein